MINLTENAKKVLEARYLRRDENGKLCETIEELFHRVARAVSSAEGKYKSPMTGSIPSVEQQWEDKFYKVMTDLEFLPNSPTLFNAGKDSGTLSGCLAGDTIIRCCAGNYTIKQLCDGILGKEFDVYTIKDKDRVGIAKASNARKTGNKEVFRVTFDDSSHIDLTTDHLIMLRNGDYVEAGKLAVGQSVMPFNYYDNYGYLVIFEKISYNPVAAHKLVVYENNIYLKNSEAIHHINYNKLDNRIENLKIMDKTEHFLFHSEQVSERNKTQKAKDDSRRNMLTNNPMWNPDAQERVSKAMKIRMKGFSPMQDPEIAKKSVNARKKTGSFQKMIEANARRAEESKGKTLEEIYGVDKASDIRKKISEGIIEAHEDCNSGYNTEEYREMRSELSRGENNPNYGGTWHGRRLRGEEHQNYGSGIWHGPILRGSEHPNYRSDLDGAEIFRLHDEEHLYFREIAEKLHCNIMTVEGRYHEYKDKYNHKVVSIISLGFQDVYDLSVEETHNFAANNIFVHNCFFFQLRDSMDSIMDVATKAAIVQKHGGGVGYSFSDIRPRGTLIHTTQGRACGPIAVMEVMHSIDKMITQGGKRAGAQMAVLRSDHLDIESFINCKIDNNALNTFNISVAADDAFMEKAINDTSSKEAKLFDKIVKNAWENGDPGLLFIDEINRGNPTPWLGKFTGTNPCLSGNTLIPTNEGDKPIKDLVGRNNIWVTAKINPRDFNSVEAKSIRKTKSQAKVYKMVAKDGYNKIHEIIATEDHKFLMIDNTYVELKDLKKGGWVVGFTPIFNEKLDVNYGKSTNMEILSITDAGLEDVYDIEVPHYNHFVANGFIVHNCGEQPLLDNESCNLGSINLNKFVRVYDHKFIGGSQDFHPEICDECNKEHETINWKHLKEVVELSVRFLDDVIDINKFPVPEIAEATLKTRKIGLGVMGWADMLIKLSIPYNSNEAIDLARKIMEFIDNTAAEYSMKLAEERGQYPAANDKLKDGKYTYRNAARTTIAPTGSVSIIAGCSSGVEPIYDLVTERANMSGALEGAVLREYYPLFEEFLREKLKIDGVLNYSIEECKKLRDQYDTEKIFVTAHEISYDWHIKTQAAFQEHVNNAVSKTINMLNSVTINDIREAYIMAWKSKCKGITIYRDGSRSEQVLTTGAPKKVTTNVRVRPKTTEGETYQVKTGCGHIYITVNSDEIGPFELFAHKGGLNDCVCAQLEAICRLISISLRLSTPIEALVKQLKGIKCSSVAWEGDRTILSCSDAIASVLEQYTDVKLETNLSTLCPECQGSLIFEEGCYKCHNCGFTKC